MNERLFDGVEMEPAAPAAASVIWLHGLGADGHDFEPVVPQLKQSINVPVRFVFPHAPVQPVSLNAGMPMRAWFDIERLDFEGSWDAEGVARSVARLDALVEREIERGVPRSSVVVAGFSQGGAVALEYLCRHGAGLAGVMVLSSFHAAGAMGAEAAPPAAPPIFAAHGLQDPVVPYALGELTAKAFADAGYTLAWHPYPMAHQLCQPEVADIALWLQIILG
ncbi:MAG: alpha/beta hydrolase [Gammaproteobacteria bacterium]|nr:alpha/beta hydrolase [Gammaproteobacteria bacterium]